MSAKWRRVQAWDREHLTGVLAPVRWVLHALSSITLAIITLVGVALYAVLASVPVGLLALIPTWIVYIASFVAASLLPGALIAWGIRRWCAAQSMERAKAFLLTVTPLVLISTLGAWLWLQFFWPELRYEASTGEGFRLFPAFVEQYASTTVRRLPAFEMTELEFYAWWPMPAMLLLFTLNMIIATIRRIEFKFVNLGVLTVHTGMVLIAIGSVYYQLYKQEGDTLLLAGGAMQGQGAVGPGPAQAAFFDREDPALWFHAGMGWEQRRLDGLPRYNDYNVRAGEGTTVRSIVAPDREPVSSDLPAIDLEVENVSRAKGLEDVSMRVVGFASYAEPAPVWQHVDPPREESQRQPLQIVYLINHQTEGGGRSDEGTRAFWFAFVPNDPVDGMRDIEAIGVEYARGMDPVRWRDLAEPLPPGAPYGFVVEIPEAQYRGVHAPPTGVRTPLGDTGWFMSVQQISPTPPFPIVTPGYEESTSSVALVRLEPPEGEPFTRWIYHRFPEISQDLTDAVGDDGRPARTDPDPRVRVGFIDASKFQVYFNEDPSTGAIDALVRTTQTLVKREGLRPGDRLDEPVPLISFDLADRWEDARQVEIPRIVPEDEREGDFIGTHDKAMIAVEVSQESTGWSDVVWLPYAKFTDVTSLRASQQRAVTLPGGQPLSLLFGRVQHRLPGFQIRMLDFEMLSYDHRGSPRDYQSLLRVEPTNGGFEPYDHITRLNAPLTAPFHRSKSRSFMENLVGRLVSHLSPNQFKFSQAGWDRAGWEESQKLVDQGLLERPRANFTILGVGNNPGIHIIALGGILMGVGTPWAFYVKPWLLKRRKRKIQLALERERIETEGAVAP